MEFMKDILPEAKKIGTLYNSSEVNSRKVVEDARGFAKELGLELLETTVTNTSEVYQAISALCMRNIDAVWITGDNTALQAFHGIVKVCKDNKMPLFVNDNDFVKDGALAAIGVGWYKTGYHTASLVASVLNGADPADIPIENFVEEEITLNDQVAKELGISFPEKYRIKNAGILRGNNYKFCLAHYVDSPNSEDAEEGLRGRLKELGLNEGADFTLKVFNAQGDISTLNSITESIASEKWDMVFSTSTPTIQAISQKITSGPVVFTNVGDPVRAGLGESFGKHASNLTGISTMSDFEGLVKLVKQSIPGITTIGTVFTPGEINSVAYKEELEKQAIKHSLELIAVPANTATEVSDAAQAIVNRGIQAFTQISDNLTASCGASIIKKAYDSKIPYFAFISKQVEQGAVAAISRDYYYAGVDAVNMAVEILQGKNPKEIPFRYVTKSNVNYNAEALEYFEIDIPEEYKKKEIKSAEKGKIKKPFETPVKIAMVHFMLTDDCGKVSTGVLNRFDEFGLVRDKDFTFDEFNANADMATLNSAVKVVAEGGYGLIFSTVLVTIQTLASKIKDVPILFTMVGNPAANGLAKSHTDHIPNITGIDAVNFTDEEVELMKQYLPNLKTIGAFYDQGDATSEGNTKKLQGTCDKYGIELVTIPVNNVTDVSDATKLLCSKNIDAICQLPDGKTIPAFATMVKVAQSEKIPLFCFITDQVGLGAVAAVAYDFVQQGKEVADMGIKILEGTPPAEIPISVAKNTKIVISPEATKKYGLGTPDRLLDTADQIIKEGK